MVRFFPFFLYAAVFVLREFVEEGGEGVGMKTVENDRKNS
jgi:hypothetical protein